MSDPKDRHAAIDMAALESIASQCGLGGILDKKVNLGAKEAQQTLFQLACSNDHKLSVPKDDGTIGIRFKLRNRSLEVLDETLVKLINDLFTDDINSETIETFIKRLEAFHYHSHSVSNNYVGSYWIPRS